MNETGKLRNKLRNWCYGRKDAEFMVSHREEICADDVRSVGLITRVMLLVTAVYFLLDLNSGGTTAMRLTYFGSMLWFLGFNIFHEIYGKTRLKHPEIYNTLACESVFVFLLLVGPVYDPGNLACYLPLFFAVEPLLVLAPMNFHIGLAAVNLTAASIITFRCKTRTLAMYDMVDMMTCICLGIALGSRNLRVRLRGIDLYQTLKDRSESELAKALRLANRDPLTGVKSRASYETMQAQVNARIASGEQGEFGLIMCDMNWLKETNDTGGHEAGDRLILDCCRVICDQFAHSPVFRVGGDEFVVFLEGRDLEAREKLIDGIAPELTRIGRKDHLAVGLAVYEPGGDSDLQAVYNRADIAMYEDKKRIKGKS